MMASTQTAAPSPWLIPPMWYGETVFILGGGPSLAVLDPATIPRPCIALNNAFLLRPDADLLYWADREWWKRNKCELWRYRGPRMASRSYADGDARVSILEHTRLPLSRERGAVAGWCSGANALNIAFLARARRVVLLGFDMRPGNWHTLHARVSGERQYATRIIPSITRMVRLVEADGVQVINATPGSALACAPMATPEEFGIKGR